MDKTLSILIGLLLILIPVYVWIVNLWNFGDAALVFLKGGIVWLMIMVGVLIIGLGIMDLIED